MDYVIFIYNVLLIVVFAMNAGCFLVYYMRTRRILALWVSGMFLLFIAENLILYMADFLEGFSVFYNTHTLTEPVLKTAISIGIYLCYLFIAAALLGKRVAVKDWVAYGIYVAALLLVPLLPTSRFTYWLYFTLSQIMFAYVGIRCYMGTKTIANIEKRRALQIFLKVSLVMNVFIVAEDFIVIFFFDDLSPDTLRITQRNLCEDIQSIYFAISGLNAFFQGVFDAADGTRISNADMALFLETSQVVRKRQMEILCDECALTGREREVLSLLLANKGNTEIGEELFISRGTVKNHIHSIYQKTGATGRRRLIRRVESITVEEAVPELEEA